MAEAHSAVSFSFTITNEGYNISYLYNRDVLKLIWNSGIRSWKKRIVRFKNRIQNGVYPVHVKSLWMMISLTIGIHWSGHKMPFDAVNIMLSVMPSDTPLGQIAACSLIAMSFWLLICYTMRYTLKCLFMYKGWMYESRQKGSTISTTTKCWAVATKLLSCWNKPGLFSFQGSLPKLPVPSIHDTIERYMRSVRPLLNDEEYNNMTNLAKEFQSTIGTTLQRYLILKSWWSTNYVSDWWEEYVYLCGRSPLMINSNYYAIGAPNMTKNYIQAAKAANIIYSMLIFRRMIDREELEPLMVQKLVPICARQYEKIFNTVRIPGENIDKIIHFKDSDHIVVLHKGCYYKVIIYHKGRLLKPCELQIQMEMILKSNASPAKGEEHLAALTAEFRKTWANIRDTVFKQGVNRVSLHTIESAAFFVSLDEEPLEYDVNDPSKLDKVGLALLHGKGCDRWFDKSFTLCIGSNGMIGFNGEHTWGDAAIMAHLWEFIIPYDNVRMGYDEYGNTNGTKEIDPPIPQRLIWAFDETVAIPAIESAYQAAQELLNTVELHIFSFDPYGKSFIKSCQVSPDAYIQMVLQLAYFRDVGYFSLTYEATVTRLFREGRTETVRSCTIESAAWVRAMQDNKSTAAQRVDLFIKACNRHQQGFQDAMCGKGIDRHLFCLYVVSKYLNLKSPFLDKAVVNAEWKLSTSQTPFGQHAAYDFNNFSDYLSFGGGFSPVSDDGYGVSYIMPLDKMYFHVSAKKTFSKTNVYRLSTEIEKALTDVRDLFHEYNSQKK